MTWSHDTTSTFPFSFTEQNVSFNNSNSEFSNFESFGTVSSWFDGECSVRVCACACACMRACVCVRMYVCMYVRICVYVCVCVCIPSPLITMLLQNVNHDPGSGHLERITSILVSMLSLFLN